MGGLYVVLLLFLPPSLWSSEEVLKAPESFVAESFDGTVPPKQFVWLTGTTAAGVAEILGHRYKQLRVAYWRRNERSVWILEEIGKVKPITAGFNIVDGQIEDFEVLIYRESHGWEIRYPFFTRQFQGAALNGRTDLTHSIDGISGATLSVNAVTRLARLALYLDGVTAPSASAP